MNDTRDLRTYLLGRFLLTLLAVGVAQAVINIAMKSTFTPLLEKALGLEGMLTGKSVTETIMIFASCIITVMLRSKLGTGTVVDGFFRSRWAVQIFGQDAMDMIRSINADLDDGAIGIYASKVALLALILVLVWIIPFVIGAVLYSRHISGKIGELEKSRINREREYEKQRNLLLSDITHDIKTPITTIAGFSKALSDGTVPDEQRQEYLDAVYNKSMKVSDLVSLLFEYIKLDSTGYVLNKSEIDLAELVRECVADSYAELEDKKFEVELDIPETQVMINADKMQLERAINNILSNTIKHNEEGTRVVVSLEKDLTDAVLKISDTGARIDKEDALHIFEPFVRGDKSRKSGTGNGLGLSITKKIVEMHDGKIVLVQYSNFDKYQLTKSFKITIPVIKLLP